MVVFLTKKPNTQMNLGWLFKDSIIESMRKIIVNKEEHYIRFKIPKKSGKFRNILAPDDDLKALQEIVLKNFLYRFNPHPIAHGFVKEHSPKTNAELHLGAKIIICMDIKDFFPSIKIDRVKRLLDYLLPKGVDNDLPGNLPRNEFIDLISELVTFNGRLPQGAPTSPAISNLASLGMDKELKTLESTYGCVVTRYCDDISVSSDYNTKLPQIIKPIKIFHPIAILYSLFQMIIAL